MKADLYNKVKDYLDDLYRESRNDKIEKLKMKYNDFVSKSDIDPMISKIYKKILDGVLNSDDIENKINKVINELSGESYQYISGFSKHIDDFVSMFDSMNEEDEELEIKEDREDVSEHDFSEYINFFVSYLNSLNKKDKDLEIEEDREDEDEEDYIDNYINTLLSMFGSLKETFTDKLPNVTININIYTK